MQAEMIFTCKRCAAQHTAVDALHEDTGIQPDRQRPCGKCQADSPHFVCRIDGMYGTYNKPMARNQNQFATRRGRKK